MEGRLFLNIVVRKSTAILKLLSSEDEALLIRRNALLVLNLGFNIVDRVGRLYLQRDRLPGESLHENLHTAAETQD